MNELFIFGFFGAWTCYAWIASRDFRSFVRARKKLTWIKRWLALEQRGVVRRSV